MARPHSQKNRTTIAQAILAMDAYWAEHFAAEAVGDLNFCDLFTEMWLRRDEALRKTDLYAFMPNISQRTAVKYVQYAIDTGLLIEEIVAEDKRIRQIALSAALALRIENFLDYTYERFRGL
ncbi:MAG: hypothetical protein ABW049_03155 [Spongiibacteraceae bacterium]